MEMATGNQPKHKVALARPTGSKVPILKAHSTNSKAALDRLARPTFASASRARAVKATSDVSKEEKAKSVPRKIPQPFVLNGGRAAVSTKKAAATNYVAGSSASASKHRDQLLARIMNGVAAAGPDQHGEELSVMANRKTDSGGPGMRDDGAEMQALDPESENVEILTGKVIESLDVVISDLSAQHMASQFPSEEEGSWDRRNSRNGFAAARATTHQAATSSDSMAVGLLADCGPKPVDPGATAMVAGIPQEVDSETGAAKTDRLRPTYVPYDRRNTCDDFLRLSPVAADGTRMVWAEKSGSLPRPLQINRVRASDPLAPATVMRIDGDIGNVHIEDLSAISADLRVEKAGDIVSVKTVAVGENMGLAPLERAGKAQSEGHIPRIRKLQVGIAKIRARLSQSASSGPDEEYGDAAAAAASEIDRRDSKIIGRSLRKRLSSLARVRKKSDSPIVAREDSGARKRARADSVPMDDFTCELTARLQEEVDAAARRQSESRVWEGKFNSKGGEEDEGEEEPVSTVSTAGTRGSYGD